MNLRRLARIRPVTPSIAVLAALILAPGVARAQHGGGGHSGAGTATHSGSYHNDGVAGYGYGYGGWGYGYPGYGYGYGYGYPGYGYPGYGLNGSVGMTIEDQQMMKEAYYAEMVTRSQMQQMQAMQAATGAELNTRQSQALAQRRQAPEAPPAETTTAPMPSPPVGLSGFVYLDRVRWPVVDKPGNRDLLAACEEAGRTLIEVHKQALTDGSADGRLVSAAKEKLRRVDDLASKNKVLSSRGRKDLNRFLRDLDLALDRSLRRPDAPAPAQAQAQADDEAPRRDARPARRVAANR